TFSSASSPRWVRSRGSPRDASSIHLSFWQGWVCFTNLPQCPSRPRCHSGRVGFVLRICAAGSKPCSDDGPETTLDGRTHPQLVASTNWLNATLRIIHVSLAA